ncbi:hypothetical protein Micbo1qcDRAFT_200418 [Microdochium bolleyi]|uniref:Zn(2)-C6 fungal-type domain-containing protein n=1 Tax=Microdochium bolleyi TaxID=196109 RepID=A0A136JCZ3_9PEZI|nr:hypothetical protein Micbo1qcDRAFT_200418 [Microdochium bolleyi]
MVRKGQPKVRTGCYTCKLRKVKCDEARPFCDRCLRTGRTCAGYPPAALISKNVKRASSSPTIVPSQPRDLVGGAENPLETRSLHYFCVHAPILVGGLDPYFWTNLSLQFSSSVPAVRHSLIAISSLFEQLGGTGPCTPSSLRHNTFALTHYNAAIYELKHTMRDQDQAVVLVVCILFICIEFMQTNAKAAIRHCRHGLLLLRSLGKVQSWVKDSICPNFHRLSLVPLMFDGLHVSDVPMLPFDDAVLVRGFWSVTEARTSLDVVLSRILRLIHEAADHHQSLTASEQEIRSASLVAKQEAVMQTMGRWHKSYEAFDMDVGQHPQTTIFKKYRMSHKDMHRALTLTLELRFELCKVLAATALRDDDDCFDEHDGSLRNMAAMAEAMLSSVSAESREIQATQPYHFLFETGQPLPMFFVAVKCRDFGVRRRALTCLQWLSVQREGLWHTASAVAVAKKVVEREHGVVLDGQFEVWGEEPLHPGQAPESTRIRMHWLDLVQLHLLDDARTMTAEELFGHAGRRGSACSSLEEGSVWETDESVTGATTSTDPATSPLRHSPGNDEHHQYHQP